MRLYHKYRDLIVYTIFGFLASIINVVVFGLLHKQLQMNMLVANTIAWFIANLFSLVANKLIVFKSDYKSFKTFYKEALLFMSQRVFTLILDSIIMQIGIDMLHFNSIWVKIFDQIFVGLVNYLATKAIFMHQNSKMMRRFKEYSKKRAHHKMNKKKKHTS